VDTFDQLVARLEPNVVAYWKLAENAPPQGGPLPAAKDERELVDGAYAGAPTFGTPTIVRQDTGGQCVRFNGAEHVDIGHHDDLKTAAGTILIFHQHDSLLEKKILMAGDANATTGGFGVEVQADGSIRSFLAVSPSDYRIQVGPAGDVVIRRAYCSVFRWGNGGLAHDLWGETGFIRRLTNTTTAGLAGTSAIRIGAWHTGTGPHDGPISRVIWLDRRLDDGELDAIAIPRTLWEADAVADSFNVSPGPGVTSLAVQANDALLAGDEQTELMPGSFTGDGSIVLNADGKRVDYTAPAVEGGASFQYRLKRGWPVSNTVTVMITVSEAGMFSGPTQLFGAKTGDPLTSVGGITFESQEPV
jgi:hypothetical protein